MDIKRMQLNIAMKIVVLYFAIPKRPLRMFSGMY